VNERLFGFVRFYCTLSRELLFSEHSVYTVNRKYAARLSLAALHISDLQNVSCNS